MPSLLRSLIIIGIVVSNFLCALAGITSTSRMMYAFARDGGLPASKMLASVDHKLRTPGAAIWVGALLSIVAVLYGDAFLILSTGCAVFLYLSYVMPVAAAMRAEMAGKWKNKGPFNLAGASIPVGALAIIGCGVLIFAGVQPPQEKVLYLIIAMVVVMVIVWFAGVRNSFQGPPVGDEIKKRQAAIAEAEKAMET
jgi:amino acid transporter